MEDARQDDILDGVLLDITQRPIQHVNERAGKDQKILCVKQCNLAPGPPSRAASRTATSPRGAMGRAGLYAAFRVFH